MKGIWLHVKAKFRFVTINCILSLYPYCSMLTYVRIQHFSWREADSILHNQHKPCIHIYYNKWNLQMTKVLQQPVFPLFRAFLYWEVYTSNLLKRMPWKIRNSLLWEVFHCWGGSLSEILLHMKQEYRNSRPHHLACLYCYADTITKPINNQAIRCSMSCKYFVNWLFTEIYVWCRLIPRIRTWLCLWESRMSTHLMQRTWLKWSWLSSGSLNSPWVYKLVEF